MSGYASEGALVREVWPEEAGDRDDMRWRVGDRVLTGAELDAHFDNIGDIGGICLAVLFGGAP